jgi:hypothetical protein
MLRASLDSVEFVFWRRCRPQCFRQKQFFPLYQLLAQISTERAEIMKSTLLKFDIPTINLALQESITRTYSVDSGHTVFEGKEVLA